MRGLQLRLPELIHRLELVLALLDVREHLDFFLSLGDAARQLQLDLAAPDHAREDLRLRLLELIDVVLAQLHSRVLAGGLHGLELLAICFGARPSEQVLDLSSELIWFCRSSMRCSFRLSSQSLTRSSLCTHFRSCCSTPIFSSSRWSSCWKLVSIFSSKLLRDS